MIQIRLSMKFVQDYQAKTEQVELSLFFEHSLDLLCVLDFDAKFIRVNRQWESVLGWGKEELENEFAVNIVYHEDISDASNMFKLAVSNEMSNAEFRWINKDGKVVWLSWKSVCLPEKRQIYMIARDISDQKEIYRSLEENRNRYYLANKATDTGIWDWFIRKDEVYFSSTWKSQVGYKKDELDNSFETWQGLLHPDDYEKTNRTLSNYLNNPIGLFEAEFRMKHKDGSYRWIHNRAASLIDKDGRPYRMLGTHRDITMQKEFEQQLKDAKAKAEVATIYKNNFLANMSHEIRTPMNGIIGFSELLKEEDVTSDERSRYTTIINDNCKVLLNLIDDIIDISKIEANELSLQLNQFHLKDLLRELKDFFDTFKISSRKDDVEIRITFPTYSHNDFIETDHFRLRQVLTNLIGNALKFTKEGCIEFGYTVVNENSLQFFVKDSGIGIPKDKLNIIFERFHQSDETMRRKFGGAGLGLSISQGIIKLLKGKMWVESIIGKGSLFSFSLPYKPVTELNIEMPSLHIPIKELKLDGIHILVVEDVDYNYKYIYEVLKPSKAELHWVQDGLAALEELATASFDLVLLDIKIPKLNGIEVLKHIKKDYPELPVIIQTAYAMPEQTDEIMELGYYDCLTKPLLPEDIIATISKYM